MKQLLVIVRLRVLSFRINRDDDFVLREIKGRARVQHTLDNRGGVLNIGGPHEGHHKVSGFVIQRRVYTGPLVTFRLPSSLQFIWGLITQYLNALYLVNLLQVVLTYATRMIECNVA